MQPNCHLAKFGDQKYFVNERGLKVAGVFLIGRNKQKIKANMIQKGNIFSYKRFIK